MNEIFWLSEEVIKAMHEEQLAEHGGLPGIRDRNLLLASLDRPKNLFAYGEPTPTIFNLAAAYAFAFAKNHAFVDGNKRIAFVSMATFLVLNGYFLEVPEDEVVLMIKRLSTDKETQESIADWVQENCTKISS
ncbi:type II toxin-antitoxin system death-on-curing family toxin [Anabaena subtropica]|uniref:Type II toxin-antitoxin system death-on-curing family toxin n=1 Tax=Anabaena subtropica FACHB-260 TaxID=2692884 RepID=A0ABR8CVC0_9NOST|nr:type II toxin-antitoxin system death-on-curing family toxin [Anabaena subtropica]MBD2347140.1 type II toxin-antitoxin system death-on-curing family toxin [Anabaena subtropica FACHB-260]